MLTNGNEESGNEGELQHGYREVGLEMMIRESILRRDALRGLKPLLIQQLTSMPRWHIGSRAKAQLNCKPPK